jgi:hypothetical protein
MSNDVPAEEPEKPSQLGLARISLVFGILSIPLAFVFIPGLIAIFTGIRARKRLLMSPDMRKGATIAFCGMMLGGVSLVIGAMAVFALPTAAVGRAKKVTTLATATAIESAVNNIYTEYGQMPDVGNRVTTDSEKGVKLLIILLGLEDKSAKQQNPRNIKFLSVHEGRNRKGGLIYDVDRKLPEGLFDPYGNPYTVMLDSDYDEQLHFDIAGKPVHLKDRRVAAFSPGEDHELGTDDDVTTW